MSPLRDVLRDAAPSASTDRVLASGFWAPAPSTEDARSRVVGAPARLIDLAAARDRR